MLFPGRAYQRGDGLLAGIVVGGRVVVDHLPVLHVEPLAHTVDLPTDTTKRTSGVNVIVLLLM